MAKLQNLAKNCGNQNTAGTEVKLYYICSCELNGFPQTKADLGGTDIGDTVTLGEAFDFSLAEIGDGMWKEATILVNTGDVYDTMEGEIGGQGFKSGINFQIPGTDAAQLEFAQTIVNYSGCLVAALKDRMGNRRIIGNSGTPAIVEAAELRTGLTNGEKRGGTYTLSAATGSVAPIYPDDLEWKIVANA